MVEVGVAVLADVEQKQESAAFGALFGGVTVLCDGAMGTMLYSGGVFIHRSFDELNVTEPDTVRAVHDQYLQAGAQVIETNTFGANRIRLKHFGLADRAGAFNEAGVRLARAAVNAHKLKQGSAVFVAGAVGSVGYRANSDDREGMELDREGVRAAFAEQIRALVSVGGPGEGVDLLVGETMMSVAEAEEMAAAAAEIAPQLPLAVLMTVDEDGLCLDGTPVEEAARRLEAAGADALGVNCSSGPEAVLEAIRRMRPATSKPLVAMPNAGLPQMIEGRHIYLSSPEYMASLARKFVRAGANWVGGCCGTTPAHIRAMRSGLRALQAMASGEGAMREVEAGSRKPVTVGGVAATVAPEIVPPLLAARSGVGRRIAAGEFVTMVEIVPPKGFDAARELAGAKLLAGRGVHAINVPDSPRASPRMSGTSLCLQIQQQTGIETVLHYTCRDRNLMSIQSDLLGAASLGLKNILCLTGDPPKMGGYPDATAVFDVDAIGLTRIVRGLNHGRDIGGYALPGSPGFAIAVAANPGVQDIEHEIRRFAYKVEAGAEFCITQPVFDLRLLEQFLRRIEGFRIPVVAGIWPLTSRKNAEFMRDQLKVSVPDEILDRMARVGEGGDKQAMLAEGVRIAQEMLAAVRGEVQGAQVSAPFGKFAAAAEVLGLHETERDDA